ncbi:hypothetical protein ILUMI_03114 [Ignelater luminosus]|uniref:RNA-directed DNA polymerase n=1 Tax=Ignelater luminosus TaxID=2038154 RepID=A0A8K0DMG8_IGNLU|nr:hypothetical protein ILUMI_03114 [Ignelater luminosus]
MDLIEYKKCTKANCTSRRRNHLFAGISTDQTIEKTLMKAMSIEGALLNVAQKALSTNELNELFLQKISSKELKKDIDVLHLKQQLSDARKIAYFDIKKHTQLYVDAGPTGTAAILSQESNDSTEIVAYASRTLPAVERRYSQIKRKTLAVTWSIQYFHLYLLQNTRSAPSARIERLCLRIQCHIDVLPQSLQYREVTLAYKGHFGIVKTKQLLRSSIWFLNIDHATETYIKNCLACQSITPTNARNPVEPTVIPTSLFEQVDVDYAGPYNRKYVFLLVNEFSRYLIAETVNSTEFHSLKPILKILKFDNGPPFNGNEFKEFLSEYNIKHQRVTPFWPEANVPQALQAPLVKESQSLQPLHKGYLTETDITSLETESVYEATSIIYQTVIPSTVQAVTPNDQEIYFQKPAKALQKVFSSKSAFYNRGKNKFGEIFERNKDLQDAAEKMIFQPKNENGSRMLRPVTMNQQTVSENLLKIIFCSCKAGCGAACGRKKYGLPCTAGTAVC